MLTPRSKPLFQVLTLSTVLFSAWIPAGAQRTFVGPEMCASCHVELAQWVRGGVHENIAMPGKAEKSPRGCETCHGPGSEHIQDLSSKSIISFKTGLVGQRSAQCLACHGGSEPNLNFRRSDHSSGKVACDRCHAVRGSENFHRMRAVQDALSGSEPGLCFQCHSEQRAEFSLPFHHPVAEGFMACSSCHQPHGSFTLRQLRSRGPESICGTCHEDTQGPFIFEHPSGRTTGCDGCHRPHGSANAQMLTRQQARFLCLECHANTALSHDLTQIRYQNCTLCHSRVHGSNLNRLLLR